MRIPVDMPTLIERIYFGHLSRAQFVRTLLGVSFVFAMVLAGMFLTADEARQTASGLSLPESLAELPDALEQQGLSKGQVGAVVFGLALYAVLGIFLMAARARDIGLRGWACALVVVAVLIIGLNGDPWIAALAYLAFVFLLIAPSRLVR